MVSKSGSLIEEISSEKVTVGQAIRKQIQNSRSVKGITYQYMDKWDYAYTATSDYYIKTGTSNPAEFTVPPIQLGTVITRRIMMLCGCLIPRLHHRYTFCSSVAVP